MAERDKLYPEEPINFERDKIERDKIEDGSNALQVGQKGIARFAVVAVSAGAGITLALAGTTEANAQTTVTCLRNPDNTINLSSCQGPSFQQSQSSAQVLNIPGLGPSNCQFEQRTDGPTLVCRPTQQSSTPPLPIISINSSFPAANSLNIMPGETLRRTYGYDEVRPSTIDITQVVQSPVPGGPNATARITGIANEEVHIRGFEEVSRQVIVMPPLTGPSFIPASVPGQFNFVPAGTPLIIYR